VYEKLEAFFDEKEEHKLIKKQSSKPINFSFLKADLFPYQQKGIEFCIFKKGAILADEMGLGKTIQAMSIAILKRQYYGFKKTLIICPASVKYQWKKEIEKFTDEKAIVVDGFPQIRAETYLSDEYFFYIINYETVLRDKAAIDRANFEFIILDEAQKIKNYDAKASKAITELNKKHGLVITGTPIENKLIDLYSVMLFVDKYRITPLWEFSYTHCIFDFNSKNKITGYYNLKNLNSTLEDIVIRRQKKNVLKDLPSVIEQNVFLNLHPEQEYIHSGYKSRLAQIIAKTYKTPYDWDQIMLLLTNMRRVSNSTYLIDKQTNFSSKIVELEQILFDQMNLQNEKRKIIIFSEWIDSLHIIEELLDKYKVGYTKLIGKVNPKKRGLLVKTFEENDDCKVFLSTEAGGSGLNLQVADTLINFEIPWNPSKKNQRIGRIDRIGQKAKKLHIFNFICRNSIELHIASGLLLKQTLFDSVLDQESQIDTVDFSQQGRAQFIHQLEEYLLLDESEETNDNEIDQTELIDFTADQEISGKEEENDVLAPTGTEEKISSKIDHKKIEEIMQKGMDFLSGMYEMTTGQKLGNGEGHKIEIDKSTGEIVMRFKF
jgi:SNF2 family DNA or RNA helicase